MNAKASFPLSVPDCISIAAKGAAAMDYTLLKALHVAADLVWFGGVLLNGVVLALVARAPDLLPRGSLAHFRRWDLWVSNPAQGLAWVFGIWLIVAGGWFPDGWLIAKLAFVLVLAGLHGSQSAALRKLAAGQAASRRTALMRYSAPVALACALVIPLLVILKPF
jgi:uncharacterized membrane protein